MTRREVLDDIVIRGRNMFKKKTSERKVILLPDPIGGRISNLIRAGKVSRKPGVETLSCSAQFGTTAPLRPI
jgi:hypothetical protein